MFFFFFFTCQSTELHADGSGSIICEKITLRLIRNRPESFISRGLLVLHHISTDRIELSLESHKRLDALYGDIASQQLLLPEPLVHRLELRCCVVEVVRALIRISIPPAQLAN